MRRNIMPAHAKLASSFLDANLFSEKLRSQSFRIAMERAFPFQKFYGCMRSAKNNRTALMEDLISIWQLKHSD